jgi:hypothetical protein
MTFCAETFGGSERSLKFRADGGRMFKDNPSAGADQRATNQNRD